MPAQLETAALWRQLNGLRPTRPMVMIDQIPWHEMEVEDELTLRCADPFCRSVETELRRQLYKWQYMRADMVVEPTVGIPKVIHGLGFGIEPQEQVLAQDPSNDVVSHLYVDQIQTEEDLVKIRQLEPRLDVEATGARESRMREIFDGILEINMQGVLPVFAPWDRVVEWRGTEAPLLDLVDRPEHIHSIMERYTTVALYQLDRLEEQGLLGSMQTTIHCTGAQTDELPGAGLDPSHVRAADLWTYGMAQIFVSVSPAMEKEFWLDYAARWFDRFGLGYYGCCEPLHHKIDLIRSLPRVRKISISPFADVEASAARIAGDYVVSRKPPPSLLAYDAWSPQAVEKDLCDTVAICARHGCPVELILKDISTVRYQPQRLWEWARIAAEVVGASVQTAA